MTTEIWNLTEIQQGQGQKEVSHNEALRQIEAKSVRVLSRTVTAEPGSPNEGDTYIIPSGATGTNWSGQDGNLAHYYGGSWKFYTPNEGWTLWVNDEDVPITFDSSTWKVFGAAPLYVISSKSGNYTIQSTENGYVFLVDASGGNTVITLPPATDAGFNVGVKKVDSSSNTVTVNPDSGNPDTIEGASDLILANQWDGTLLSADGVDNWISIGGGGGGTDLPILDNESKVFANAANDSKAVAIDCSNLSPQTRTVTFPDKDGTFAYLSDITGGGIASDQFDEDSGTTTGLTWGYQAGKLRVDNTLYDISAGTVSLADDTTNYVEIDVSTQTVVVNQTGFTSGDIPIREVVTASGSINTSTDQRAWVVAPSSFAESNRVDVSSNANTSITLSSSEANGYVRTTASSAVTITVPSTTNFTIGDQIHLVQAGSGQVTFAEDTGVTVNSADGLLSTRVQYSVVTLVAVDTDTWDLMGDLA